MTTVAVLDYGSGNLRSAVRAMERAGEAQGAEVVLTADATVALEADGLLVPGVGAFEACMQGLRAVDGERIIERRLIASRPVLGICVGMQILFAEGIEHGVRSTGCGEWPGTVEHLQAPIVPHMGWNTVEPPEGSRMFAGLEDERFYFEHSYGVRAWKLDAEGTPFAAPGATWTPSGGVRLDSAVVDGAYRVQ